MGKWRCAGYGVGINSIPKRHAPAGACPLDIGYYFNAVLLLMIDEL